MKMIWGVSPLCSSSAKATPTVQMQTLDLSLTSHADINRVQPCGMHFDDDLVGVVDDGEAGVFGEPQDITASIFINDPGRHDCHVAVGGAELSPPTAMPGH